MDDNVTIGLGSTIYITNSKLYIKCHVVIAPDLTDVAGKQNVSVFRLRLRNL